MRCQLCQKSQAQVVVTSGYRVVQTLRLCRPCSKKHWEGNKYCSLRKLVTVGLTHYSIKEI